MGQAKRWLRVVGLMGIVLFLFGCNPVEDDSDSSSFLILLSMTGTSIEGQEANYLQSDVILSSGTVTADAAKAVFKVELLEPNSIMGPSHFNNVVLTKYTVTYMRSDGNNRQGVDVPYAFDGSLSTLIEIGTTVNVSFIIVREVAKLEPPLVNLLEGRGEGVLQVTARVEFYGHDMTNRKVKVIGYLTIFFANYTDT